MFYIVYCNCTCTVRSEEINLKNQPYFCKYLTAAYTGPCRKHYCKHRAHSLMVAPMECRNI